MKIIETDGFEPEKDAKNGNTENFETDARKYSSPEEAEREIMQSDEENGFFKNFGEKSGESGKVKNAESTVNFENIENAEINSDSHLYRQESETSADEKVSANSIDAEEKAETDAQIDGDGNTSSVQKNSESTPITEFEDIGSNSQPAEDGRAKGLGDEEEQKMNFFVSLWKNKRRRAKIAYGFVCFVMIIIGVGYGFVNAMLDKIEDEAPTEPPVVEENKDVIYEEEDQDLYAAVSSAGSLNDYVKQWYYAGEPMQSKNVINVLLLGLDSKHGLTEGGRSDTMMLVSLNTKTKKIHMVSFFRDSWVYFKTPSGGEYYNKMNAAYFYGKTAKCTVETIENVFKVKIDHYVVTDFKSFQNLVDAVGGIRVDVQEYESKNMMREWQLECPVGENVLLNGKQAFYFARQRHSDADADVSRTRRQRQVIMAFIESCKGASMTQLTDMLNKVFKYFQTDMTKTEILGYATRALANGWLNYDIEQITITDPEIFKTPTIGGMSVVVQDYPKVAQIVQNEIYGQSNVVLEDNRVSIFSLYR